MSDLLLDLETMDIGAQPRLVDGDLLVVQQLHGALGLAVGEDPEDPSKGLPWPAWSQSRRAPIDDIRARCTLVVQRNPSVARVVGMDVIATEVTVSIAARATLVSGRTVRVERAWQLRHPTAPRLTPEVML